MRMPRRPTVIFPNDTPNRILVRTGEPIGFSKSRVVWRFGMLPESDAAKAYGVSTEKFTFVLTDWIGNELGRFEGFAMNLPKRFQKVLDATLFPPQER